MFSGINFVLHNYFNVTESLFGSHVEEQQITRSICCWWCPRFDGKGFITKSWVNLQVLFSKIDLLLELFFIVRSLRGLFNYNLLSGWSFIIRNLMNFCRLYEGKLKFSTHCTHSIRFHNFPKTIFIFEYLRSSFRMLQLCLITKKKYKLFIINLFSSKKCKGFRGIHKK